MNTISYISNHNKRIAFCIVDDIQKYDNDWTKQIIKNIADFTISNVNDKGYDVFVGYCPDQLLKTISNDYDYATVISPGTEFINGLSFFDNLEKIIKKDFFIAGHILDRKDAYYELHHQCYVINLETYRNLGCPEIGKQSLGDIHKQCVPWRSPENIHDDYTPVWVAGGDDRKLYQHKCHGWNILGLAFEKDLNLLIFDDSIRNSKRHHYPESQKDFVKNLSWIYYRNQYCATQHIHTTNTEGEEHILGDFDQIIIPASGTLYLNLIKQGTVIFYDYNQLALDYWKSHINLNPKINYKFIKVDLLSEHDLLDHVDKSAQRTLINLSNIFCYEGTAALYPLFFRIQKENELLSKLNTELNKECILNFSMRAATGFDPDIQLLGPLNDFRETKINDIKKPTWHYNNDLC